MMKTTHWILAAAIVVAASAISAGERPNAEDLLTAFQKSVEKLARVRIETTETTVEAKPDINGGPPWKRELTILRDGSRWKIDEIQSGTRLVGGKRSDGGIWNQTVVGDETIEAQLFNLPPQEPAQRPIVIAFRDNHAHRVWSRLPLASVLFGRLGGDGGLPLWTIMGEDTTLELLPQPEIVSGTETWVLKSRGKYGEHKAWFDPASGGLPRRIEVRKQFGDLHNDEQLGSRPPEESVSTKPSRGQPRPPSARQDIFTRIDNIQIESKGGLFVITAFDYDFHCKLVKTPKDVEIREEFRVRAIEVDPKPWPEDAFSFDIKIPNGLRVGIFVNAPLEFGVATPDADEDWIDGKLQKRFGK